MYHSCKKSDHLNHGLRTPNEEIMFSIFIFLCIFQFQVNVLVGFQATPKTDELLLSNSFMKLGIEF